jgi:DNA-binding winged helix-turn-helix (wHTH) protein
VGFLWEREVRFGRYRFHPTQGLMRGRQEVRVTPKSLAVLRTLAERPGEVVSREELFRAVWADTAVSESALTTCIQELRRALADDARNPKYIETVHRRGFRFLAGSPEGRALEQVPSASSRVVEPVVGRAGALDRIGRALEHARAGRRQVVLVTGEPGIGKSTVVELFLSGLDPDAYRVARAECVEHHGAGEAYQPLLEALARLCSHADRQPYLAALRQCAPGWLAQLPALQTKSERLSLQRRAAGTTPERMLRELTDALETMSRYSPIVLCLDDLHWSDASTIDWIASFARRQEPSATLVIGTYRPGEAVGRARSPEALAADLAVRQLCTEISLARLDEPAVREYVMTRFPPREGSDGAIDQLAALMYRRTEGNPLFLVNALTDLISRDVLVNRDDGWMATADLDESSRAVPGDIRRSIEGQIDRLDETERGLLEVASVAGRPCAAAVVAAGADTAETVVESILDALARRHAFVRGGPAVEWPDGTVSATFEFLHSLYRDILSGRLSPARRADLHRRIGARLESAYGPRATEVAAELAVHFERGRDPDRAVRYLQHAAETDRGRSAHGVAERHYRRALDLLVNHPEGRERDEREIGLRVGLGGVLMQTRGWGAPEVEAAYARVRHLTESQGPSKTLFSAFWNLWIFCTTRGRLAEARSFADRLFDLAQQSGDPEWLLQAHHAAWSTLFTVGDLHGAEAHAADGLRLCDGGVRSTLAFGGHDAGICARMFRARTLALGDRGQEAGSACEEAVELARQLDHPFTLAFALMHAAAVHEARGDPHASRWHASQATQVAGDHGFGLMRAWATCFLGWSMTRLGEARHGQTTIEEGVSLARSTGARLWEAHMLGLLASAQIANGLVADATRTVEEAMAMADETGERFYYPQLQKLRLALRSSLPSRPD